MINDNETHVLVGERIDELREDFIPNDSFGEIFAVICQSS